MRDNEYERTRAKDRLGSENRTQNFQKTRTQEVSCFPKKETQDDEIKY